jgi:hypothetical protein
MEKGDLIEAYGSAIEQRRATVLVGAGLSFDGGYPSWGGLLKTFRDALGLDESFTDLPMLAQHYINRDAGGRTELVGEVCKVIGAVVPQPAENHRLLDQLPVDEIWTTNYDPLIEMAVEGSIAVEVDEDLTTLDASAPRIYKMHGSIHAGGTEPVGGVGRLVISRDDFDQYEVRHPRFWRLLHAQFLTRSFLYLGFSLSDPNFEAVLRLVRLTTPDQQMAHYAIVCREETDGVEFDLRSRDLLNAGVNVIEVRDYSEVTDLLRRLVARTRPSRLFISGSEPVRTEPAAAPVGSEAMPVGPADPYPASPELSDELRDIAVRLGRGLAAGGISVTTANMLGATAGYALLDALVDYDPGRMMLIRRHKQKEMDPPNTRRGLVTFTGEDPSSMRGEIFEQVRAIMVIGGGGGTLDEVGRAEAAGMGVVPIGCSGGTAHLIWAAASADLDRRQLGGRSIDPATYAALGADDLNAVVAAAVKLVRQAMYLPEDPVA